MSVRLDSYPYGTAEAVPFRKLQAQKDHECEAGGRGIGRPGRGFRNQR
jgi:hypothetical protein